MPVARKKQIQVVSQIPQPSVLRGVGSLLKDLEIKRGQTKEKDGNEHGYLY